LPSPRTQKGAPKPPGSGKKKGTQNKTTREFKEAINHFIEHNQEKLLDWMEQIESPDRRIDLFLKVCEFAYPKLARTDITSQGEKLQAPQLVIYLPEKDK
jgi:hypothetical protein